MYAHDVSWKITMESPLPKRRSIVLYIYIGIYMYIADALEIPGFIAMNQNEVKLITDYPHR